MYAESVSDQSLPTSLVDLLKEHSNRIKYMFPSLVCHQNVWLLSGSPTKSPLYQVIWTLGLQELD